MKAHSHLRVALLAVVYFASAKLSLALAIPPGYATAVWPPSGIALASVLLFGNRVWPGIWLGAALASLTVTLSPIAAIAIGSGNTLEALAGATLVRRHIADAAPYFDRARNVVKFVVIAALCSTIAATAGVSSIALAGEVRWADVSTNWGTWWHGDTAGIIIIAPLILTWSLRHEITWTPAKIAEASAFALLLVAVSFVVFGHGTRYVAPLPLTFLILPFIIWAAFRFSRREVTTAIAVACAIAVWFTVDGEGPFAYGPPNLSLTALLAFVSSVVATGLMMSAAVTERARALTRLEQALSDLRDEASRDPLTGLHNRRTLWEFLQREWIRARRRGNSLAVIMVDLDHFKSMNDVYGHDAGDEVLAEVGRLLQGHIRRSDIACRFGGEEFAIVLPEAAIDAIQRRAEDIRQSIRRLELRHRGTPLGRITASLGVALLPHHATDPESLLRAADQALYEAKRDGRDRVVVSAARAGPPAAPPTIS